MIQRNRRRGTAIVFVGVILSSLNLRAAVTSLSDIFNSVASSVHGFDISMIGTLPLISFAIFGLLAPLLARRFGYEISLLISMILVTLGLGLRILAPTFIGFATSTIVALAGMAFGNTLLPPLFKKYFPDHIGMVTAIYAVLLAVSAGTPSIISSDTVNTLGWRFSLGIWSIVGLVAALPWLMQTVLNQQEVTVKMSDKTRNSSHPHYQMKMTIAIALLFGVGGMLPMYTMINWLPSYLATVGFNGHSIGTMMFLYNILGIGHSIIVPLVIGRMKHPYYLIVLAVFLQTLTFIGFWLVPGLSWAWVVIAAPGLLTVPAAFQLFNLRSKTAGGAAFLSSIAQFVGYMLATLGPLVFGWLKDWTGNYNFSFAFMILISLLTLTFGFTATLPGYVEDSQSKER